MLPGFRLTVYISRLQRFKIHNLLPGALPQAITFRALGAGKFSLTQARKRRAKVVPTLSVGNTSSDEADPPPRVDLIDSVSSQALSSPRTFKDMGIRKNALVHP